MDTNNASELRHRPSSALARRPEPLETPVTPIADIYETPEAFVIRLDMPGAGKESIAATLRRNLKTGSWVLRYPRPNHRKHVKSK